MTLAPPQNLLSLIGNTPMVKVTNFDTGPCELFLKLESANPGGSIKDRIGRSMIAAAKRDGHLGPHQKKLIEATAGNTGLGLALVAALEGFELTLVIPDKMSQEKILHLKALGAKVVMTRSDVEKGHPAYYQDMAQRIATETGAFYVNQFANPANPQAHEDTTGPEILEQMGGRVDAIVVGVGSGGTLTGLSRAMAKGAPNCEMVLADPKGSALTHYVETGVLGPVGSWLVEGIGEDFLPPNADLSGVKQAFTIDDRESLLTVRALLVKEGILGGTSSGTLIAAALRYCRAQTTPKRVVTFVCDSGNKYLSKVFNDFWMAEQGFITRPATNDLHDVLSRRFAEGHVITIAPGDTLLTALNRLRLYDISQLPVMEGGRVVGMLDEGDVLLASIEDESRLKRPVSDFMSTQLETVDVKTDPKSLLPLFARGLVPLVFENGAFLGLVTRMDVLNHLRRQLR